MAAQDDGLDNAVVDVAGYIGKRDLHLLAETVVNDENLVERVEEVYGVHDGADVNI